MKKLICAAVCLCLALSGAAMAEGMYEGVVTGTGTVSVYAPYGAIVEEMMVRSGDRVEAGQAVARMRTNLVYAPIDGVVSGVFAQNGDSTESIVERYGACVYVEPMNQYVISASTEKAYDRSENKFVHIGEEVFMKCTADGSHTGRGVLTGVADDGKYTVESSEGEFCIGETVGVFRSPDYAAASRIGRGTVAAAKPVAVKGSGSVLKMHVENGQVVERGQLLFETVEGGLDGLYAPGNCVYADVTGIVAKVDASQGAAVNKDASVITIYPDSGLQVEIPVPESELSGIQVGQKVAIEFAWDGDLETRLDGEVTHISYVNSAESGEPTYTASVKFEPDDTVRLGMTVWVYTRDAAAEDEPEEEDMAEAEDAAEEDAGND